MSDRPFGFGPLTLRRDPYADLLASLDVRPAQGAPPSMPENWTTGTASAPALPLDHSWQADGAVGDEVASAIAARPADGAASTGRAAVPTGWPDRSNIDPSTAAIGGLLTREGQFREQGRQAAQGVGAPMAAALGLRSGASMNFDDELAGASRASGLPDWTPPLIAAPVGAARMGLDALGLTGGQASQDYADQRDYVRGYQDEAFNAHPVATLAGQFAGGAALPVGAAAGGANLLSQAGRGLVTGAAYGALSGAGSGEGAEDRAWRAGASGTIGGTIGGLLPGVGPTLARTAAPVRSAAMPAQVGRLADDAIEAASPAFTAGPYGKAATAATDDGMDAIRAGILRHLEDPTLARPAAAPPASPVAQPFGFGPYGKPASMATDDAMAAIRSGIMDAAASPTAVPAALGLGALGAAGGTGAAQAAPSPPVTQGPSMTSGIPFGFGFGPMAIPNADPDDVRRLTRPAPFDPAQMPTPTNTTDMTGPMGALVHNPGWSVTRTGPGQGPVVAMDEAGTQRLESQMGMVPGGGVQTGQQGRYPGLAELFDRSPMGAAQSFKGTSGTIVPGQDTGPRAVPLPPDRPLDLSAGADASEVPPTRYTGLGGGPAGAPPASSPARPLPGDLAVPPGQSAGGAAPQAQAPMQAPAQAPTATPAEAGGGFLSRLGDPRVYNTLLGLGQGLLTTKGFGPGIAAGTAYASKLNKDQAATDLAQAEYGLKTRKLSQEALGNNLTYQRLVQKGVDAADAQAALGAAMAGHTEALSNLLNNNFSKKETDKTQTPLTDPEARARVGIAPNDKRPAWSDPDGKITFNEGPKAQVSTMIGPAGEKVSRVWNQATGTFDAPDYGAVPPKAMIDTSDIPPGVDPTTYRKELAKGAAAEQKGASARALQARDALPILDRAEKSYQALADAKAIGPYSASRFNRAIGGAMGADVEVHRQDYEAAAKELELAKAQISMKGQGAITEGERAILRMTLPRLDAASPETGLTTMRGMRDQFNRSIGADRLPTRSGAPSRTDQPARQFGPIPGGAAQALQRDPSLRDQFDAKYGAGAADLFLKGR